MRTDALPTVPSRSCRAPTVPALWQSLTAAPIQSNPTRSNPTHPDPPRPDVVLRSQARCSPTNSMRCSPNNSHQSLADAQCKPTSPFPAFSGAVGVGAFPGVCPKLQDGVAPPSYLSSQPSAQTSLLRVVATRVSSDSAAPDDGSKATGQGVASRSAATSLANSSEAWQEGEREGEGDGWGVGVRREGRGAVSSFAEVSSPAECRWSRASAAGVEPNWARHQRAAVEWAVGYTASLRELHACVR